MTRYCTKCGAPNDDSALYCEKCGEKLDNTTSRKIHPSINQNEEDKASIGYNILAFIIPLVGFILFFMWKDKTPNKAKSILMWSAIGFGIGMVYYLQN